MTVSKKFKLIWNIVTGAIVALFVVVAILLVGVRLVGLEPYTVLSGSMEPTYPVGSLIYVKSVDPQDVTVGQPITFVLNEDLVVATHRVVEIDEENHSVYINDASVSIDLGGVAKGFAVQKLYEELTAQGVDNAILNAGGNVMLIGEKSDGTPWRVGVQTPSTSSLESGDVAILSLNGSHAVVTSGDYQRYYEVDGAIISHIVDPTTRWPSQLMRSVTVVCDDSTMADCISTTLFTMTYEEGLRYLQTLKENGIQAEAVWVFDDSCPSIPQSDTAIRSGAFTVLVSDGLTDAVSS